MMDGVDSHDALSGSRDLAALAPARTSPAGSLRAVSRDRALSRARTCYDHLAGAAGALLCRHAL